MRVAVLGMGKMGHALAERLLGGGHAVTVWNRTPHRADDLVARGAHEAATPAQAAARTDATVTSLADDGAVRDVVSGPNGAEGLGEGGDAGVRAHAHRPRRSPPRARRFVHDRDRVRAGPSAILTQAGQMQALSFAVHIPLVWPAGAGTLRILWGRRYTLARFGAALAVAAVIAGWALAQQPLLLPHLTIWQAAAGHDTLVTVAVLAGAVILFPSLALLFRLVLGGTFDRHTTPTDTAPSPPTLLAASSAGIAARIAAAALLAGIGFLTIADAPWAHAIGILSLLGFAIAGFNALTPTQTAAKPDT
jgi:hypothetical protein